MCFRKQKKVEINSKYHINDFVDFRRRGELEFGFISNIYLNEFNEVMYDINIGGQCPATIKGIKEEAVLRVKKQ